MASEGLDEEQALDLAYAMGLVDENSVYAGIQTDFLRGRFEEGLITAEQYYEAVSDLADSIDRVHDKDVLVTVRVHGENVGLLKSVADFKNQNADVNYSQRASGGPVSANMPYIWQEYRGGEVMVPSQNGYVLSRADAENILSRAAANHQTVNNFYLTMPTSNNPTDVISAYETMKVMIGA